jgi:hypothetical protein
MWHHFMAERQYPPECYDDMPQPPQPPQVDPPPQQVVAINIERPRSVVLVESIICGKDNTRNLMANIVCTFCSVLVITGELVTILCTIACAKYGCDDNDTLIGVLALLTVYSIIAWVWLITNCWYSCIYNAPQPAD